MKVRAALACGWALVAVAYFARAAIEHRALPVVIAVGCIGFAFMNAFRVIRGGAAGMNDDGGAP